MKAGRVSALALALALALVWASGCSFVARDTNSYERDTSALLDTREAEVRACFEAELARNRDLLGTLTLTFTVAKQTGEIQQLQWDRDHSTVNEVLATCVLTALVGLTLAEPDRRDGVATFRYSFRGQDGP